MQVNYFTVISGTVGGFFSYCLGWNKNIEILLWVITLDIIVGVAASFVNDQLKFNSVKMYKGIVKKIIILALVSFSHQLDIMMNTEVIIGNTVTYFFVANEGLSLLENAANCGLALPPILQNSLEQVKRGDKK